MLYIRGREGAVIRGNFTGADNTMTLRQIVNRMAREVTDLTDQKRELEVVLGKKREEIERLRTALEANGGAWKFCATGHCDDQICPDDSEYICDCRDPADGSCDLASYWRQQAKSAEDTLAAVRDDYCTVLASDDGCADAHHCACVPHLRRALMVAKEENERLRSSVINTEAMLKAVIESKETARRLAEEECAALRARADDAGRVGRVARALPEILALGSSRHWESRTKEFWMDKARAVLAAADGKKEGDQ